jgi:ABC-type sugar transport system ATPase subunit
MSMGDSSSMPLLEARGISKAFGHVQALRQVSFELRPGEVLALLGDNGAGKSTLIKIVSGLYAADDGELVLEGAPASFAGPKDAVKTGIATVYQDLALVDSRDVAQNIFLGSEFTRGPFVDKKRCRAEAELLLRRIAVELPSVRVPVSLLSGGQRQAVAVARALVHGAKLVIMDEPTAALGVAQTEQVMKLIDELRADGKAVIVISHNLRDVWDIADRFLVLHLGRVAGVRLRTETSLEEIVRLIVYGADEPTHPIPQPVIA